MSGKIDQGGDFLLEKFIIRQAHYFNSRNDQHGSAQGCADKPQLFKFFVAPSVKPSSSKQWIIGLDSGQQEFTNVQIFKGFPRINTTIHTIKPV